MTAFDNTHTESERLGVTPEMLANTLIFSGKDMRRYLAITGIAALISGLLLGTGWSNDRWRAEIVKHGAAHYDAKTGEWAWGAP